MTEEEVSRKGAKVAKKKSLFFASLLLLCAFAGTFFQTGRVGSDLAHVTLKKETIA